MFNGIIEDLGEVRNIERHSANDGGRTFSFSHQLDETDLKIGDSIAVNGVCTTVLSLAPKLFSCFASKETLCITNLATLEIGQKVNLERSMSYQGRIDGHLVYGHVDQTAKLLNLTQREKESSIFEFKITSGREYLIPKGSIAINGISLTVYQLTDQSVEVMIIPHTLSHTNLHELTVGDAVNIEFDMMGKYLKQYFDRYTDNLHS